MSELHGLHEALIEHHNFKMREIAQIEIELRILGKKKPDDVVAKKPLQSFAGVTGYEDITAFQMAKIKEEELQDEYSVLAAIKEMIQEGNVRIQP